MGRADKGRERMKLEPVSEHYVRGLLRLSSCFGCDRDGQPNVCHTEPCACAQSLLQEICRPLEAELERLREQNEQLRAAIRWTLEVRPGKNPESGGAIVYMTWEEFRIMRALASGRSPFCVCGLSQTEATGIDCPVHGERWPGRIKDGSG